VNIERRETSAWAIAAVLGVVGIVTGWNAYHDQFEQEGTAANLVGAVFMVMGSRNQKVTNTYTKMLAACEKEKEVSPKCADFRIEAAEDRLNDLEYEKGYIGDIQQALGVKE